MHIEKSRPSNERPFTQASRSAKTFNEHATTNNGSSMSTDSFHNDERPVCDRLALERTLLANERTLLAYVRTAIMLAATGVTLLNLYNDRLLPAASGWS